MSRHDVTRPDGRPTPRPRTLTGDGFDTTLAAFRRLLKPVDPAPPIKPRRLFRLRLMFRRTA